MRFTNDLFYEGYEHIDGGERYASLEAAREVALANFREWFPLADPDGVVEVHHDQKAGCGYLTARFKTEEGRFATDIEFQDYRPVKRLTGGEAKMSMF